MSQINFKWLFATSIAILLLSGDVKIWGQDLVGIDTSSKWSWTYDAAKWCNNNVPVNYHLTKKQMSSILYLKSKYDEIIPFEIIKLDSLKKKAVDYKSNTEIDTRKIKNNLEEIILLNDYISELRLEARIEIRKVLSAKQSTYFNDFVFSKWWEWRQ